MAHEVVMKKSKVLQVIKILLLVGAAVFGYLGLAILTGNKTFDLALIIAIVLAVGAIGIIVFEKLNEKKLIAEMSQLEQRYVQQDKTKIYPFDIFNYTFMILFGALCIFPMVFVLAGSFNQGADYAKGGIYFVPRVFSWENYKLVLEDGGLFTGYKITLLRTVIGTVTSLIFTALVAYGMSRKELRYKNVFYWINMITMFFGGGLIPFFLIIKSIGLFDTFWVYIVPSMYSVYNMIIISSFYKSIPEEIHESAIMDGAKEITIFFRLYIPLAKSVLATVALWNAVGHWNSFFDCIMYTSDKDLTTLQLYLYNAIQSASITEGMPAEMKQEISSKTLSFAAVILSMIPVVIALPFITKYFSTGVMVGSLKG